MLKKSSLEAVGLRVQRKKKEQANWESCCTQLLHPTFPWEKQVLCSILCVFNFYLPKLMRDYKEYLQKHGNAEFPHAW